MLLVGLFEKRLHSIIRCGAVCSTFSGQLQHIRHCTHTAESADVIIQNIFHVRNNITSSTDRKYGRAGTLNNLEERFVSGT